MDAIASNGEIIKTGDTVLVRTFANENWKYSFFSHIDTSSDILFYATTAGNYMFCIPYNGNEHFVGTTKELKSYEEKQKHWVKKNNIKEGNKVKIARKFYVGENGWYIHWRNEMDSTINKIGVIENINTDGIIINVKDIGIYSYPYHVLEKIEDKFEFRFGAKVRAIYNNSKIEGILIKYTSELDCMPYCIAVNEKVNNYSIGTWKWVKFIEYID